MSQGHTAEILVVVPDANSPLDRFESWLSDRGLRFTTLRPYSGDPVPHNLRYEGLVVMGGEMSALDDEKYPWLKDIRILFRDAVRLGRPTLGICLGAQLLAQSMGGTVQVGDDGVECGLVQVDWTPEAAGDELVSGLAAPFPTGAYHQDIVAELPPGATWLGTSSMYPHQAFRCGHSAWGVQFHPELSPALYNQWAAHHGETADDALLTTIRAGAEQLDRNDGDVSAATQAMADRFASIVLSQRAR